MKICTKCKCEKIESDFHKDKSREDGLFPWCKDCVHESTQKYYELKRNSVLDRPPVEADCAKAQIKKCSKCGEDKATSLFGKDSTHKDGLRCWCKECRKTKWEQDRAENLDKKKIAYKRYRGRNLSYAKEYTSKNKEMLKEKNKKRQSRPDVREKIRAYTQKQRDERPDVRLNNSMRAGLCHSIKSNKAGRKWQNVVGYTLDELKKHLERKFKEGMTWDNYGEWEIDHIIPLAAHNFTSQHHPDFKRAWDTKNLQPLWAAENRSKKDKLKKPFQPSLRLSMGGI